MKTNRAAVGGETGINGEDYKGGQFLPNTFEGKQHRKGRRTTGKQQIAPFVWEVAPNGERAIFAALDGCARMVEGVLLAHDDYAASLDAEQSADYARRIAMWNAGKRWL